jgi:hypothetical protein
VDSGFKILNPTIQAIITQSIQIDVFLCSLIRFLARKASTTAVHNIADLDSVKTIAINHSIVSKKFRFLRGFLIKSLKSCRVHHHNSSIKGKNETKKYP